MRKPTVGVARMGAAVTNSGEFRYNVYFAELARLFVANLNARVLQNSCNV